MTITVTALALLLTTSNLPAEARTSADTDSAAAAQNSQAHSDSTEHTLAADHETHSPQRSFAFGLKGVLLNSIVNGEVAASPAGVGLFGEYTVIPGWLEVEAAGHLLSSQRAVQLPVDLLFKLPMHLNEHVHPFVGLGPMMVVSLPRGSDRSAAALTEATDDQHGEEPGLYFGVATAAGSYFWLSDEIAVSAELNYNLVAEQHLAHELGGAIGLVVGY